MFPQNKFILLCKLFCLAPISNSSNVQRILSAYCLITVICLIVVTAFSFSIDIFGEGFVVSSLATSAVFVSGIVGHITVVLESLLKKKEHEYFFAKLYELEYIFRFKLRHRIQVRSDRKHILRKYSKLSVVIIICFGAYITIISTHDYLGYFWLASVSVVVNRMRLIQACVYVDFINFRFDSMNLLLKQVSNSIVQHNLRIPDIDYEIIDNTERIFVLKTIYTRLNKLVLCLNEAFGWSIVTLTVYYSLDITCNLYWLFLGFEDILDNFHIYECCVTIFPIALLLFALSHTCCKCEKKGDVARQLVQQILVSSTFDHTNYLLDAFLLQINNQPIVFHAKHFFNVNAKLLPNILSSMLAFLVILIQFQLTKNEL
uniref:Gustatory receptor n=1 Tax=Scaeva pyrastri TaxID=219539 RepID=A0A1B3B7E1_SCAPY|nr:putative gustatory receptor GR4 [Scaeva pyrastri]